MRGVCAVELGVITSPPSLEEDAGQTPADPGDSCNKRFVVSFILLRVLPMRKSKSKGKKEKHKLAKKVRLI